MAQAHVGLARPSPYHAFAMDRDAAAAADSPHAASAPSQAGRQPTPANRLGLDYAREAQRLSPPPAPIIDIHTHINGRRAAGLFDRVRRLFGVERVFSMTPLPHAQEVKDVLGEAVEFIAVPDFRAKDRKRAFTEGRLEAIQAFHEMGARIAKFWAAPRAVDYAEEAGEPGLLRLDGPWSIRAMELAASLGMRFMTHVADPDTWFATKYADASRYGAKLDQYTPLRRLLDRFPVPWIAAHMGGWPEDLDFLDRLLEAHPNLHLDTSATKWMVRELSKHPRSRLLEFFERWQGRLLFGSDIVTTDEHFRDDHSERGMGHLASDEREAFDLYASRYYALRTLFETDHEGESPIADPDLAMVDPTRFDSMSAPTLRGMRLPKPLLRTLYADAARQLLRGPTKAS